MNCLALLTVLACVPQLPHTTAAEASLNERVLEKIEPLVFEALEQGQMSGCVVAIGHRGKLGYLRAFGHRQLQPEPIEMTVDTVFDLASLTKPVATATSILQLVEAGKVRLRDPVAKYRPEFAQHGKDQITLFQLLTHQGGLIPDNHLNDYRNGLQAAMENIDALKLYREPGSQFVYTDVGFILLADIVEQVTGQKINDYVRQHIFQPLGMNDTGYLPAAHQRARAAATEQREGRWMKGEVHDPRAYLMEGVAGHAGLFSTAADLSVFAQMMLQRGTYADQPILLPSTVALLMQGHCVGAEKRDWRALGWDKQSRYSSNRGENMSLHAIGHGGFTGTAMWVDPAYELFVIFLSSRLHPDGKGSVNPLAGKIATLAVASVQAERQPASTPTSLGPASLGPASWEPVSLGIDQLVASDFRVLQGKRVGLITNHTGVDSHDVSTLRRLHEAEQVQLVALFSPEHGLEGKLDIPRISDTQESQTGLKVHSLYGETRIPTPEQLAGLDALVFDIQDIGSRFYTYISTMGNAMEAAAKHQLTFVVLDRPNPINGVDVEGPLLDADRKSFVGYHELPVRHGMTVGELARMFQAELKWDLDLRVVPIKNWRREQYFDETGMRWINPSPNMRNPTQALLYPGIGLLETTNLSVGRGTDTPFEILGAPWINARELARSLNAAGLPGIRFVPLQFTPESSKFANQPCPGVHLMITDRERFEPLSTGIEIAVQLRKHYPGQWEADKYLRLLGNARFHQALLNGASRQKLQSLDQQDLREFLKRRERFLLYP